MRSVLLFSMVLSLAAACGGGDAGDVAGVFPDNGFIGRKTRVEISGNETSWNAQTKVEFGAGVTVGAVELVSPSSIQVDITVDPTAAPGKQDVTVTDGGDKLVLAQAFELKSAFSAEVAPNFEQGGFGLITITNLDLLNPIDPSTDDQGNFTNLAASGSDDNVAISVSSAAADSITLNATIDVNATTTGPITVTMTTAGGALMTLVDPVAVAPRTPTALTIGTPTDFTVTPNGALLEVSATEMAMLHIDMTAGADAVLPGFILLPASGKFADAVDQHLNFGGAAALDNRIVATGDKFYMVAVEILGTPGYMATFNARSVPLANVTGVTDTGDNTTPAKAQALTGAIAQFDGVLTDKADVDCFKIAMAANKKLHVFTTDENGVTDSTVQIFDNALATAKVIASSDDADFGEDVVTGAQATAATRAACVSASSFAADDLANAPYKAFIVVE